MEMTTAITPANIGRSMKIWLRRTISYLFYLNRGESGGSAPSGASPHGPANYSVGQRGLRRRRSSNRLIRNRLGDADMPGDHLHRCARLHELCSFNDHQVPNTNAGTNDPQAVGKRANLDGFRYHRFILLNDID